MPDVYHCRPKPSNPTGWISWTVPTMGGLQHILVFQFIAWRPIRFANVGIAWGNL